MKPVLFACAATTLSVEERDFFAACKPFGFVLFKKNCDTPDQIKRLIGDLHQAVGWQAPIFIDQEGGRVQRLTEPHWRKLPALRAIGALYEKDKEKGCEAARLHAQLIAHQLLPLGIQGTFSPVLDLLIEGASSVIGDRAISGDAQVIADVAAIMIKAFVAEGIAPVIKHMPGHGRVKIDPHVALPFVDEDSKVLEATDFVPFKKLADAPFGMNCHVVFRAIDADNPVSLSRKAQAEIIRGALGFKGILFSDDLAMKALSIPLAERARKAIEAGTDIILYCSGQLNEGVSVADDIKQRVAAMQEIVAGLDDADPKLVDRFNAALPQMKNGPQSFDWEGQFNRLQSLLKA